MSLKDIQGVPPCACLDSPHTGGNTGLAGDLKRSYLAGVLNVCAAAEFSAVIAHSDNPDLLGILFIEERRYTLFPGLFKTHDLRCYSQGIHDLFVDLVFHPGEFISCHGFEVGEIKSQSSGGHERACLFDVTAEHFFECSVKQMGGAVV